MLFLVENGILCDTLEAENVIGRFCGSLFRKLENIRRLHKSQSLPIFFCVYVSIKRKMAEATCLLTSSRGTQEVSSFNMEVKFRFRPSKTAGQGTNLSLLTYLILLHCQQKYHQTRLLIWPSLAQFLLI